MSTPLEIVSGSSVISTSEVLIATLTAWHPNVDVYVDPVGDPLALGTMWRVYACKGGTKTLLAEAQFTGDSLSETQRVLSIAGFGTTIELRASTQGRATTSLIKGAIVGWDPAFASTPDTDADSQTHVVTGPAWTTFGTLAAWHPEISLQVDATAGPAAVFASTWEAVANIAGFNPCVVAAGLLTSTKQTVLRGVRGGCTSWSIRGRTNEANATVTAAVVGYSPGGDAAGGGGVASVTGSDPITSTGGANPVIGFTPASSVNFNAHKAVNLLDPTLPQDAATKAYVDAHQERDIQLTGTTPGGAPGESVELLVNGATQLILADGSAYTFNVQCVAKAHGDYRAFFQQITAFRTGGVTTFVQVGTTTSGGTAGSAAWTLVVSVGAAPDRLVFKFFTNADTAAATITADLTPSIAT